MNPLPALSKIRVRLVLSFGLAFLAMAAFGGVSYSYFFSMEQKLVFLSQADAMVNMALEARRYEKNYFLYHQDKDFRQALDYLKQYESMLTKNRQHLLNSLGFGELGKLAQLADSYGELFRQVHKRTRHWTASELKPLVKDLRLAGKSLVEHSEKLARSERNHMHRLIKEYRPLLIIFLVGLAAVGSIAVYYFLVRLVRPLHTIEEATKVVGQGDFRPIPHDHREDEIGQLIKAFNRMVLHLKQNNEQMVQTEKLTSLGTLTSGVAHELNNPLNNISTSCQILLEEMPPETEPYHTELLRAIDSQVEIARDIVGSLLEFSRRRQFKLERQNLKQVVSESLKLIRGETPVGVEAKVDIPGNLALYLDKGHIVQALINLFMNSFQAMEKGGILTISARELKESGQIRLTIQDTGKGIPPEVLPQVFDPFFTTKKVGKGTGLGLSITYGIIERHHGHIKAESEQDQGAKIIITLPLNPKEG